MDQTDTGLKAVIKALKDVVAPALDPADPLAQEQLRLAIDYIGFVRARIDYLHGRERFDLQHYIGVARAMQAAGVGGDRAEGAYLAGALAPAEALAGSPSALTHQIRDAAMELGHAVAGVIQAAGEYPPAVAAEIRRIVLDATAPKLEYERIWYAPIGFEAEPPSDRTLEDFAC